MNGVGLIAALVIGVLAGWIAEKVMSRNHGLLTNLIVGVVGSFVGAAVAGLLGFAYAGLARSCSCLSSTSYAGDPPIDDGHSAEWARDP